jgi:hypothetical protein
LKQQTIDGRLTAGRVRPERIAAEAVGEGTLDLTISRWAVTSVLTFFAALVIIAHIIMTIIRSVLHWRFVGVDNLYTVFGLWAETSFANWFSSTLLFLCALVLAVVTLAVKATDGRYVKHWAGLALLFLILAIDEGADAHGQMSHTLYAYFRPTGYLLYIWIIPAAVLLLVFALLYLRFVIQLPSSLRWRMVLAGAIYVVAALVLEAFQGRHDSLYGTETMTYKALVTLEESLEMGALIFFIFTLLTFLRSLKPEIRITVR